MQIFPEIMAISVRVFSTKAFLLRSFSGRVFQWSFFPGDFFPGGISSQSFFIRAFSRWSFLWRFFTQIYVFSPGGFLQGEGGFTIDVFPLVSPEGFSARGDFLLQGFFPGMRVFLGEYFSESFFPPGISITRASLFILR